jgi:serine/threonine protein kinase
MTSIAFKEMPTDRWLNDLVVRASSDDTMILLGKLLKDKQAIVKLEINHDTEHKVLSLLDKTRVRFKNLPVIYGTMSCYEKKSILSNKFHGKGLCYGSKHDADSVKVYLSVMSYIDGYTLEMIGDNKLQDHQVVSLIMQGMMTIYQLFYVFGIMHRDFNTSNIIIAPTSHKAIDYKIKYFPYRFFPFELDDEKCYDDVPIYQVETHGIRLHLIDFDKATVYHHDHLNADVKYTIIEEVDRFITTMLRYGSRELSQKYQSIKDLFFERIKACCQRHQGKYNQEKTPHNNFYMLDRCTISLRVYCKHVSKALGIPLGFCF